MTLLVVSLEQYANTQVDFSTENKINAEVLSYVCGLMNADVGG